jgi:large subunit ribosomal protein L18
MATNQKYVVGYRRKRTGRTDYHKRLKLLAGETVRLVIRKSLHHMRLQLVQYEPTGDKVLVSATTEELHKKGYKGGMSNVPAAYLCGMLLANKAKDKKIAKAIVDIGLSTPVGGSVLFAAVAGALAAGLSIPVDKAALPSEDRLTGKHIADYAKMLKKDEKIYNKTFSAYIKNGLAPEQLPAHIDDIKKKLK